MTSQEKRPKLEIYRTPDQLKRSSECMNMNRKTGDAEILNKMKQNNNKIQKRGEEIDELQKKTNQMSQSSFSYLDSCKQFRMKLISSNENREGKEGGHAIIGPKEENNKEILLNAQSEITQKSLRSESNTPKPNRCSFNHYENDFLYMDKKHSQIKEIEISSSERKKNKNKKKASWLAWCC